MTARRTVLARLVILTAWAAAMACGGSTPVSPSAPEVPTYRGPSLAGTWKGTWTAREVVSATSEAATATFTQTQNQAAGDATADLSGAVATFSLSVSSSLISGTATLSSGGKCQTNGKASASLADGVLTIEVTSLTSAVWPCAWAPAHTIRLTR